MQIALKPAGGGGGAGAGPRLSPPPRPVPLAVRSDLIFGGALNQFGWIFFGFGMIFVWVFLPAAGLSSAFAFRGDMETAEGVVEESVRTNYSEGGSKHHHGTPVYATRYSFKAGGRARTGVSYATGRTLAKGAKVTIEFPKGDPSVSRIQGMRTSPFGPFAAIVVLYPLIGLGLALAGFRNGFRAIRLLTWGREAEGTLVSREATNVRINKHPVYRLTFKFEGADKKTHTATAKTHRPEVLEDDARERLLYDPARPEDAVLFDALPGSPAIDPEGGLRCGSAAMSLMRLLLPGLSILGNGIAAVLVL